nr:MAG TPA: hypothetical protein [Caudoviricetes sp.]
MIMNIVIFVFPSQTPKSSFYNYFIIRFSS